MALRLVPLLNRVLVQKIVTPAKTAGGILLPESAIASKLNSAKVIATGPGGVAKDGSTIPVCVKVGDTVLLPEYGGTEVKLDDKEFFFSVHEDGAFVFMDIFLESKISPIPR